MLKAIQGILQAKGLVGSDWADRVAYQAELVALFRNYYDGEHRLKLTNEMKKMMQIKDDRLDRYNANYCDLVVHAMSDRLEVDGIDVTSSEGDGGALEAYLRGILPQGVDVVAAADYLQMKFGARGSIEDDAQAWLDGIMRDNRFDALQIDVHIAALRDGETYVMAAPRRAANGEYLGVQWAHESAFDGDVGMIVVWDSVRQSLTAAVKIWRVGDGRYVNIYYPESIAYYLIDEDRDDSGALISSELKLLPRKEAVETRRDGFFVGVPVVVYQNKAGDKKRPRSELLNVIPLQDSLNRGLVSLVMAEELTAFRIMLAKGVDVSGGITPGMVFKVLLKDSAGNQLVPEETDLAKALADYLGAVDIKAIEGGDLSQFIAANEFVIGQIAAVSNTPLPQILGGDEQSGEALKQRESGLLGKVGRVHVQFGNSWEDLARLSERIGRAYSTKNPPVLGDVNTRWKDAQIRNDGEIQASAEWYWSKGFLREALRVMSQSSLAHHSEKDIDKLLAERRADAEADMAQAGASVPGFGELVV